MRLPLAVLLAVLGLCLAGMGGGSAQRREVPGDRIQLRGFSYDGEQSVLRWRGSVGYLDADGKYHPTLDPLICSLNFNRFEATCGDQTFDLPPAIYADSATEFNAVMEHLYRIAAMIEQERSRK